MRVLLVNPRSDERSLNQLDFRFSTQLLTPHAFRGRTRSLGSIPLALPTLAALTPAGVEVDMLDENLADLDLRSRPDIAAISCLMVSSRRAFEVADAFRSAGVHVALGGIHASMLPDEAGSHADTVFIGEAEETWPRFIEDFRAGRPRAVYPARGHPPLDRLVVPRWDLTGSRYLLRHVQTSRGCVHDCDFCCVKAYLGTPREKPIANVIAEVTAALGHGSIFSPRSVVFVDDNIIANPGRAAALFRALEPLGVPWVAQVGVDIARNADLLDLAVESGCSSLIMGFESVSQASLDGVNKGRLNRVEEYGDAIRALHARRITLFGLFIFGFDEDPPSIFDETIAFVRETNILFPVVNILTPPPGTRLFASLEAQHRILHREWDRYSGSTVCFEPKRMSSGALQAGFTRVLKELYAPAAILDRLQTALGAGQLPVRGSPLERAGLSALLAAERGRQPAETSRLIRDLVRFLWKHPTVPADVILQLIDFHVFARDLPAIDTVEARA